MRTPGLIPCRFLVILSHIVITLCVFIDRKLYVGSSLSYSVAQDSDEWKYMDNKFIAVLSVAMFLFALELFGFFSGISMFRASHSLVSASFHMGGTITMCYYVWWGWDFDKLLYTVIGSVAVPAMIELQLIVLRIMFRQGL